MIGYLPKELNIGGTDRAIRSDFRTALLIFQAYNEPDYTEFEKAAVMFECLYEAPETIPQEYHDEAIKMALWFLDGGGVVDNSKNSNQKKARKTLDWEQDERLIFSAINKVAGFETRAVEYLHWWTFLGYFNEIGEGLFTTVMNIRQKKNDKKKLEKHEEEFYKKNKELIDLKVRYSEKEVKEREYLNKLLNS